MSELSVTDLCVAMLRVAARRLRAGVAPADVPHSIDQVARASIESGRDNRNLTTTRDQKGT
ncbi:hypothetical protein GGQ99_004764 [Aminobacter niigataensis]|uniref:Uncharacterized protein n=1 Tax=Aminobacter niigataensis TaxID=83265 RepID=A0ABR6LAE2_9HYPH|nr:hypothetical protein [Aminobacter niigataensis]MBB4652980.1 hypothetical protein [Aminobacter niigataensis]